MCVVSMVGDHYTDKWRDAPWIPAAPSINDITIRTAEITRAEFEELKHEVEEMKKLLIRAKRYDEENNEPDCEMDDKVVLLKKIAEAVGVDLTEVFG